MYTIKYRPNDLSDFIGNKHLFQPFIKWLLDWDTNYLPEKTEKLLKQEKPKKTKNLKKSDKAPKIAKNTKNKCALISGLTGVGKSLLVELILKKHGFEG
jgi:replicative superfamily II helicase